MSALARYYRKNMRSARSLLAALAAGLLAVSCSGSGQDAATTASSTVAVTTLAPPLTAEELPTLALSLDELPDGFSVTSEDYLDAGDRLQAAYRRVFDPSDTRLGKSTLAGLVNDVVLFDSEADAIAGLDAVEIGLSSGEIEQRFNALVQSYTGIEATDVVGRTLVAPTVGDGAVLAEATFNTTAGRTGAAFLVVRIGALHAALFAIGPSGEVDSADLTGLMDKLVVRVQASAPAEPEA